MTFGGEPMRSFHKQSASTQISAIRINEKPCHDCQSAHISTSSTLPEHWRIVSVACPGQGNVTDRLRLIDRRPRSQFRRRRYPRFGIANTFNGIPITSMDADENVGECSQVGRAAATDDYTVHSSTFMV